MTFADTMRRHIFKYEPLYAVGGGSVLIVCGLSVLIIGDIYGGIGYTLIGISIITSSYIKRKLMFVCSVVTMGLALWIIIFKPFSNSGDETARREAGVQQEAVDQVAKPNDIKSDTPKAPTSKVHDAIKKIMPPELQDDPRVQKMMEVMASDSFQKQAKAQNPQTIQEYADLLEAHGVTELSEIDFNQELADAYDLMVQKYQTENPGKAPEEEDEAMAKRFGEVLKASGLIAGMNEIMMDWENVLWISARFKGDETAFNEWWGDVVAIYESDNSTSLFLAPTDSEFPHGGVDIPSDETTPDIPLAEAEQVPSDRALTEVWENPPIPDTAGRGGAAPIVEPEKIVTSVLPEPPALPTKQELETALRERFSSERFERAMSTLERYGPEEGLRRLREDDPEVANQIEQHRNREVKEEGSQ